MEEFDFGQGVENKGLQPWSGAIGSDQVKKLWASTRVEELPTCSRNCKVRPRSMNRGYQTPTQLEESTILKLEPSLRIWFYILTWKAMNSRLHP